MDLTPPVELHHVMALQSLALPSTLTLCFTSMLRERAIGDGDEKRLIRLYKQHAFALELLQLFVILMAFGLITGNTVAALEARNMVIKYANEEITASIVRSALVRNLWLVISALCNLICVNMLDSWSLPQSVQDLTDPLLRLTREAITTCQSSPLLNQPILPINKLTLHRHPHTQPKTPPPLQQQTLNPAHLQTPLPHHINNLPPLLPQRSRPQTSQPSTTSNPLPLALPTTMANPPIRRPARSSPPTALPNKAHHRHASTLPKSDKSLRAAGLDQNARVVGEGDEAEAERHV